MIYPLVISGDDVRLPLTHLQSVTILRRDPQAKGVRHYYGITVERCDQPDGVMLWAVRSCGDCYGTVGWEHEPMPSWRDDAFYARCRYDTLGKAVDAANKAVQEDAKP